MPKWPKKRAILQDMPLGKYKTKVGMQPRQAMLVNRFYLIVRFGIPQARRT